MLERPQGLKAHGCAFWLVVKKAIATFAPTVGRWPILIQTLFYLVLGIAWIAPLRPLLRWSQTGRWKADPTAED